MRSPKLLLHLQGGPDKHLMKPTGNLSLTHEHTALSWFSEYVTSCSSDAFAEMIAENQSSL